MMLLMHFWNHGGYDCSDRKNSERQRRPLVSAPYRFHSPIGRSMGSTGVCGRVPHQQ